MVEACPRCDMYKIMREDFNRQIGREPILGQYICLQSFYQIASDTNQNRINILHNVIIRIVTNISTLVPKNQSDCFSDDCYDRKNAASWAIKKNA